MPHISPHLSLLCLPLLALCSATPSLAGQPQTLPPKTLTVAADGSADFKTLQQAVDAAPENSPDRITIAIKPGTYKQHLVIPKNKPNLTFKGLGQSPHEVNLTEEWYASYVPPNAPTTQPVGTWGSASVTVLAEGFEAENIQFENSAGPKGQAVALLIQADRGIFRNCRFLGYQDTLCIDGGRQYFLNCFIKGRTDFIFGQSVAVFDRCEIYSYDGGYITAARTLPEHPYGYVFLDCALTGEGKPAYLGRPWQWDRGRRAAVIFLRTKIGPHIHPEGWNPWHLKDRKNEDPASVTRYYEHASTDLHGNPLDLSQRVPWAKSLTPEQAQSLTPQSVLSSPDNWNPVK